MQSTNSEYGSPFLAVCHFHLYVITPLQNDSMNFLKCERFGGIKFGMKTQKSLRFH